MNNEYCVYHGQQVVGQMQVKQCGLYYTFSCRCDLQSGTAFTVEACCGENKVNLGICVPSGNQFGLQTKIPVKRFAEGEWHFYIKPKHAALEEQFYPIHADEPFAYIQRLNKAYFAVRDGQFGVVIGD